MSRPTPFCRSFVAAFIGGTVAEMEVVTVPPVSTMPPTGAARFLLCLGSRCSMWLRRQDETPNQRLGCCAEAPTAEPWIDPAKETV